MGTYYLIKKEQFKGVHKGTVHTKIIKKSNPHSSNVVYVIDFKRAVCLHPAQSAQTTQQTFGEKNLNKKSCYLQYSTDLFVGSFMFQLLSL